MAGPKTARTVRTVQTAADARQRWRTIRGPAAAGPKRPRRSRAASSGLGAAGEGAESPAAEGSDPIKEYADKATDLALEYLEDQLQQSEPDQQLLDRLGWSRDELARFVRRWQKMKADARQSGLGGDSSREELDDALRSLGLRPSGTSLKAGGVETDNLRKTEPSGRTAARSRIHPFSSGRRPRRVAPLGDAPAGGRGVRIVEIGSAHAEINARAVEDERFHSPAIAITMNSIPAPRYLALSIPRKSPIFTDILVVGGGWPVCFRVGD